MRGGGGVSSCFTCVISLLLCLLFRFCQAKILDHNFFGWLGILALKN